MEQYNIKVENFEGPLDLLCYLIDKNKMDICDIKIAEITDQYIEHLKIMEEMNLEVTSEFIVMASKLIYLKSKSILPKIIEENEESELDLVKLLLEYKRYKESTFSLKERMNIYSLRCFKMPEKVALPKNKLQSEFSNLLIPQIYNGLLSKELQKKNTKAEDITRLIESEKITVKSKIKEILKALWKKPSFIFNKLFNIKEKSKPEIITAFLGLLELSKMSRIKVTQSTLFGDIDVSKIKKERT